MTRKDFINWFEERFALTKKKGFEFGKSKRVYRIDSNWYESKEDFIKALKNFGFGPQKPIKGGGK